MTVKYCWQKLCKMYFASFKYLIPVYHSFSFFSKKQIVIIVFTSWNRTNSCYHICPSTCSTEDKSQECLIFFPNIVFCYYFNKTYWYDYWSRFIFLKSRLISYSQNQSAESTENGKPLEMSIKNWKLLHLGLEGNTKVPKQTLIGNCSILQFSFSFSE